MKRLIALSLLAGTLLPAAAQSIKIDASNFPDENFRNFVENNYDTNKDGSLSSDETDKVTEINVDNRGIAKIQGVQYFTNLENLIVANASNSVTDLNDFLPKLPKLKVLDCAGVQIKSLDLSGNGKLTNLTVRDCSLLKEIKFAENCPNFSHYYGAGAGLSSQSQLENLPKSLVYFDAKTCHFTSFDFSEYTNITNVFLENNSDDGKRFNDIKFAEGYNKLEQLNLNNADLTTGPLTNQALQAIISSNTSLTGLWIKDMTGLTSLDFSKNANLHYLWFGGNPRLKGNVKGLATCTKLLQLQCSNCGMTNESLPVDNMTELQTLYADGNKDVTKLNLDNLTQLTTLFCYDDNIPALELSHCTELANLSASKNIQANGYLDISNNKKLKSVIINDMGLKGVKRGDNNLTDLEEYLCSDNPLEGDYRKLDFTEAKQLRKIICSNDGLTSVTFSQAAGNGLNYVDCRNNQIASLDITGNPNVETLNCGSNAIDYLDLTKNARLKDLACEKNHLTSLNLEGNTQLTILSCHDQTISKKVVSDDGSDKLNVEVAKGMIKDNIISDANHQMNVAGKVFNDYDVDGNKLTIAHQDGRYQLFTYSDNTVGSQTITYDYNTKAPETVKTVRESDGTTRTDATRPIMNVTISVCAYNVATPYDYSTLTLPYNAEIPEGTTAFYIANSKESFGDMDENKIRTITVKAIEGSCVAANTPILVYKQKGSGNHANNVFNKYDGEVEAIPDNLLRGVVTDQNVSDLVSQSEGATYIYSLTHLKGNDNYYGFFRYAGATLHAFRSYFTDKDVEFLKSEGAKGFVFDFGPSTDINHADGGESSEANEAWYTISGMKLNKRPTHGGVYIHNGKKVII